MGLIVIVFSLVCLYGWYISMRVLVDGIKKQDTVRDNFNNIQNNNCTRNDNPSLGYIDSAMFLSMYDE